MIVKKIVGDWLEANTYVVIKGKDALIIDCGANLDKVKNEVHGLNILGILLTHGHFDHSIFALDYAEAFGCKVFASHKIFETLSNSEKNYSEGKFYIDNFSSFKFLKNDGEFFLGKFTIKNYSCSGHSPCCESYLIENLLFAGDVLFSSGIGRIDIVGSNKQDMVASLEKLKDINFDMLYSGHGEQSTYERQQRNITAYLNFLKR